MKMSELTVDDCSIETVNIEENVAIKEEVCDSYDSDFTVPLSDFMPDERGNAVVSYEGEHRFIGPQLIEDGPSGRSSIGDSASSVGRVKSLICPQCGRAFLYKSLLDVHISGVHLKVKKYVCGECDRGFTRLENLKRHLESVHLKLKKYACGVCDRAFTEKQQFNSHVDAVHKKLKKYSCVECKRAFTEKSNLKKHLETVHELKRYVCSKCDRAFTRQENLKKHLDSVHVKLKK